MPASPDFRSWAARVANQARQLRLVVTLLLLAFFVVCIIVGAFLLIRRGGFGGSHGD